MDEQCASSPLTRAQAKLNKHELFISASISYLDRKFGIDQKSYFTNRHRSYWRYSRSNCYTAMTAHVVKHRLLQNPTSSIVSMLKLPSIFFFSFESSFYLQLFVLGKSSRLVVIIIIRWHGGRSTCQSTHYPNDSALLQPPCPMAHQTNLKGKKKKKKERNLLCSVQSNGSYSCKLAYHSSQG